MATVSPHTLVVSSCNLDAQCKATLATMLRNGWRHADTVYTTSQQVLSISELSHLLRHGGLSLPSGPIPSLRSYTKPDSGLDVAFKLNVNLS